MRACRLFRPHANHAVPDAVSTAVVALRADDHVVRLEQAKLAHGISGGREVVRAGDQIEDGQPVVRAKHEQSDSREKTARANRRAVRSPPCRTAVSTRCRGQREPEWNCTPSRSGWRTG